MTSTEIGAADKIMLGSTEADAMYAGGTLLWQRRQIYDAEVEYICCTGSQYIDTLFYPSNKPVKVETCIRVDKITSEDGTILAARDPDADRLRFYPLRYSSNGFFSCNYAGSRNASKNSTVNTISVGVFYTIISEISNNATVTVDNTTSAPTIAEGFNGSMSLYLFATNYGNSVGEYADCAMKYMKIYEDGILMRDFIPVRVGRVGYLYDRVTKRLFGNQGSGVLTCGNDLNILPQEYTQLEYISSTKTGGQYIDLNVLLYDVLNKNYDIAIRFNMIGAGKDNTAQSTIFGCQDNTGSPWPGTFIRQDGSNNRSIGRYIGGTAKDNVLGNFNTIVELSEKTPPAKNVYNYNNSSRTHTWGTSLFCIFNSQNKTATARFAYAKLYYFKLFVEGTLVRDLIPCKDSNNVVGMYDVVNNTFYTSPNGAAFVAGPEV